MADEVIYRGYRQEAGGAMVMVETADGQPLGLLPHIVRHSPSGFQWGYGGSGPAELARCVLLAALGEQGYCLACEGTQVVIFNGRTRQFLPRTRREPDPGTEVEMGCDRCDDGRRQVPYQEFKWKFVAQWGAEWRISRGEILGWLRNRGVEA